MPAYCTLKSGKGETPRRNEPKRFWNEKERNEGGMMMKTLKKMFALILGLVALGFSAGAMANWQ